MDLTFGITLHFNKKKEPPLTGKVFYRSGEHVIEIHDPKQAGDFIRGLIPPYSEEVHPAEKGKERSGVG